MADGKAKKSDLAVLVAAALSASAGCYVQHAPYAVISTRTPQQERVTVYSAAPVPVYVEPAPVVVVPPPQAVYVPRRPIVVPSYEVPVFGQECHEYAASAADSMDPNGRHVGICTGVNVNPYARREWSRPFPTVIDMSDFPYQLY
jgi:hypothetical protein